MSAKFKFSVRSHHSVKNRICKHVFGVQVFFLKTYYMSARLAIHLSQNMRKHSQNTKGKKRIASCFAPLFSRIVHLFFAFCILHRFAPELAFRKMSKGFINYFFVALTKCEIYNMKYKKCIVSVSYFVVRFAKALVKNRQNVK